MKIYKQADLKTQAIVEKAVELLLKEKQVTGFYNVRIDYKGLSWVLAITTYDGKPYDLKRVHVNVYSGYMTKEVAELTPAEAGYSLKEVSEAMDYKVMTLPINRKFLTEEV